MKNSACTENNVDVPLLQLKYKILYILVFLDERRGEEYLKGLSHEMDLAFEAQGDDRTPPFRLVLIFFQLSQMSLAAIQDR